MGSLERAINYYHCHMQYGEIGVKVKPDDRLRIDVTISLRYENYLRFVQTSTLLKTTVCLCCRCFFQNNRDFLSILVLDPPYSNFFAPESIDEVSGTIRTLAEEIFEFCSDTESSEYQEFPLKLDIIVDLVPAEDTVPEEESEEEEEEIDNAVIEESMQQDAAMIPASSEAIHSLKTFTILPSSKRRTEECNICLEQFRVRENEENVKFSSMPCHHVFHHYCIVKWLQISHTCPLCRYPMPTEN